MLATFLIIIKYKVSCCISILRLHTSLRLVGLNNYFYDVFFQLKMSPKKGIWKWRDFFTSGLIWSVLERSLLYYFGARRWYREDANWKTFWGTGEVPEPYFQWKWAKHWKMWPGKMFCLLHWSRCLLHGISRRMETQQAHSYLCHLEKSL